MRLQFYDLRTNYACHLAFCYTGKILYYINIGPQFLIFKSGSWLHARTCRNLMDKAPGEHY